MSLAANDSYIKHEIKIGIQEFQISSAYKEIQKLHQEIIRVDQKIDAKFNWFYGLMVAAIFVPKILGWLHLN